MSRKAKSPPANDAGASALWGGRFAAPPAEIMQRINASIGFDRRLYAQDIAGSRAHAAMLADQGIISKEDGAAIAKGLDTILREINERGTFSTRSVKNARTAIIIHGR